MLIYLNHRFVSKKQATVSVFDHGFLYGDGVFETLRAYKGRYFLLREHLARLRNSAKRLGIPLPFSLNRIRTVLYQTLTKNHLPDALVRISLTRGPGPIGLDPAFCRKPTLVVIPRIFNGYPSAVYRKGMKLAVVSVRRISPEMLDPQIKSMNFLNNIMATIEAKRAKADEGLMLSREGFLCEGSTSNIFVVKNGRLFTPPTTTGILVGTTRQVVFTLARSIRMSVVESYLLPSDLYNAEECFLTNTSMEIMPVCVADGRRIGAGSPGPLTCRLRELFKERVRSECGISAKG